MPLIFGAASSYGERLSCKCLTRLTRGRTAVTRICLVLYVSNLVFPTVEVSYCACFLVDVLLSFAEHTENTDAEWGL